MTTEIALREDTPHVGLSLSDGPDPATAVAYARQVSAAILGVLEERSGFVTIQGRKHFTIEGWQTLAAMTGHTAEVEWSRIIPGIEVERGAVTLHAWEARAVVRDQSGRVVATGESMASPDEGAPWARNDFSIRSMAQTRATSRALAARMRYIVTLAGFAGTPAEEMPTDEPPASSERKPNKRELIAWRQGEAERRAADLGVTDFPAFFSDLGVTHPDQLYTEAKWKKVTEALDAREAEAVEGEVVDGQEELDVTPGRAADPDNPK